MKKVKVAGTFEDIVDGVVKVGGTFLQIEHVYEANTFEDPQNPGEFITQWDYVRSFVPPQESPTATGINTVEQGGTGIINNGDCDLLMGWDDPQIAGEDHTADYEVYIEVFDVNDSLFGRALIDAFSTNSARYPDDFFSTEGGTPDANDEFSYTVAYRNSEGTGEFDTGWTPTHPDNPN